MTHQDKRSKAGAANHIAGQLRAISVGSFLFQLGVVDRLGLHPTDLHAIHLLGRAPGGLTAGELGRALALTSGSTTAVIARLERRDFVIRRRGEHDGRRVEVRLTETARRTLESQYGDVAARVERAIEPLDESEREVVAAFLDSLVDAD